MKLTDNVKRDIIKYIESDKDLPEKYRFLLFEEKREVKLVWTGDYVFGNGWQSFRTKKDRTLELASVFHQCPPRKVAVKEVDTFGNDTMKVVEVGI
jgi:hypothetical protein